MMSLEEPCRMHLRMLWPRTQAGGITHQPAVLILNSWAILVAPVLGKIPQGLSHGVENLTKQMRCDLDHTARAGARSGQRGCEVGDKRCQDVGLGSGASSEWKPILTNTDLMSCHAGSI